MNLDPYLSPSRKINSNQLSNPLRDLVNSIYQSSFSLISVYTSGLRSVHSVPQSLHSFFTSKHTVPHSLLLVLPLSAIVSLLNDPVYTVKLLVVHTCILLRTYHIRWERYFKSQLVKFSLILILLLLIRWSAHFAHRITP